METIRLYQGTDEVAPLRLCEHLSNLYDDIISVPGEETLSLRNVKCPNCGVWMCERCQDDAVRCAGGLCVGRICAECQATARKRRNNVDGALHDARNRFEFIPELWDFLCAPCCARQDEQIAILLTAIRAIYQKVGMAYVSGSSGWLDEILEALDSATAKARETL